MIDKNNNELLLFIHIEKCAGSTFNYILANNFKNFLPLSSGSKYGNEITSESLKNIIKYYPGSISGAGGHNLYPNNNYRENLDKKVRLVTFLRNPIKRYLSHLNYQINEMGIDWTIESFVDEKRFSNFQVKKICGDENLSAAIKVIDNNLDFVGILEHFDASMLVLKSIIGPKFEIKYEVKNEINNNKKIYRYEDLSEEMKIAVKENNKLDMELYSYVYESVFKNYLDEFNITPNHVQKFMHENKSYKFPLSLNLRYKYMTLITKIIQRITLNR